NAAATASRDECSRALEHALVELLEASSQYAEVEPLQHHLLAGLTKSIANRRIVQQIQDALGETRDVAVGRDQAGYPIGQREFDVLGFEGNDGLAEPERLEHGDADEALDDAWLDIDVG